MALVGNKSAFSSLTIKGAFVLLIPMLLALFGINLGADAAGIINNLIEVGIQFVGLAMVIYGRLRATQKVTLDGDP
jgi:hypothetical protein